MYGRLGWALGTMWWYPICTQKNFSMKPLLFYIFKSEQTITDMQTKPINEVGEWGTKATPTPKKENINS